MTKLDLLLEVANEKTGLTGRDLQEFVALCLAEEAKRQGKFEMAKQAEAIAARQ